MVTTADLISQLDASWTALQAARPRVEAGAPWPISDKFDNSPEAYWYPPEVLAHISELLERWLGVVETVADGVTEPVSYGQAGPNPARLAGIERNRHLPIPELYSLIGTNVGRFRERLIQVPDADLGKRARHPSRGDTTLGEIITDSVTGHFEEHVRQVESLLAAAGR